MSPMLRRIVSTVAGVVILAMGVGITAVLVATRPQAQRTERSELGIPVRVRELAPERAEVRVRAQGTVVAAQQVTLTPELNGRVTWRSPNLVPGGRVSAGDVLLRIDTRDYRAALEQQRAQVENARVSLQQEQSRRVIAEREWALLRQSQGTTPDGQSLALREPQVRSAEAAVEAASSALQQARTNLGRTTLIAPFDAFVQAAAVDVGQVVGPSSQLATLVGTSHFWVRVAVPVDQLSWIEVPGLGGAELGSRARIRQEVGSRGRIEREGRVIRLQGDLDPVGRMARVLVEIPNPLEVPAARERGDASGLPLLTGAFVHVEIEAGHLDDVFEIPRTALHGGQIHVFGDDDRLALVDVDVVWRRDATVLVRGPTAGQRLLVSRVPTPIAGTLLRISDDEGARTETPSPTAGPDPSGDEE